ncbi:MAG: 16S rRNA (guanine(527)-N(7))-methyltransferase RsmG [Acidobacteria bacterium 13_1_40CM_4_65_8]|nr:MAG: 16S rRNA (guanine(527)-N(7))-methyltransferase RsmG [Acidobacteria bacterium 13_1_40CM_4_65_8]
MTSREFQDRLMRRARRAKVAVAPETADMLEEYFGLLDRWNTKINLTALPLHPPTDESFDRLFVEPLAAARFLPNEPDVWLDLGSGGGSPAIPLKAVRPKLKLTMVESKVRKAAFLREAVRTLKLRDATVENARIETLGDTFRDSASVVTVRAVKVDATLLALTAELLRTNGRLVLFRPTNVPITAKGFEHLDTVQLTDVPPAYAAVLKRVFHVEQSR